MTINEPADQERYEALAAAGWYDDDDIGRIVASIEAVHTEEHMGAFAECPDLACQLAIAVEKQAIAALNATVTPAPDYEYDGDAYIRPMGRGVVLKGTPSENDLADYLENALGAYQHIRIEVRAWKKDGPQ